MAEVRTRDRRAQSKRNRFQDPADQRCLRTGGNGPNRRSAIGAVFALLGAPGRWHAALAQSPPPRQIAVLHAGSAATYGPYNEIFVAELAKLGWIEGRNLAITYRYADGDASRLDTLASEIAAMRPEAIFASCAAASFAAHRATKVIPVVMSYIDDPVAAGLVQSLSHPGGNVTGTANDAGTNLEGKRLELLKQWLPHLASVAVFHDQAQPRGLASVQRAAEHLGVRVHGLDGRNPADIEPGLARLVQLEPDAVFLFSAPALVAHQAAICERLSTLRLPSIGTFPTWADAGCLMAYSPPVDEIPRESAMYIDRILRGANPAELPVSQPMKYELSINARTAKSLGLTIPTALRLRADRIVE